MDCFQALVIHDKNRVFPQILNMVAGITSYFDLAYLDCLIYNRRIHNIYFSSPRLKDWLSETSSGVSVSLLPAILL